MARKKKTETDYIDDDEKTGISVILRRWIITLLIIALILYIGTFFVVRTDGFRSYVAERISERAGLPVKIERTAADLALHIHVYNLTTENISDRGVPGFRVEHAKVIWSIKGMLTTPRQLITGLELDRPYVAFRIDPRAGIQPSVFKPIGRTVANWGGITVPQRDIPREAASDISTSMDTDIDKLEVSEGTIRWWDGSGNELAYADGINFIKQPLEVIERIMIYYQLDISYADTISETRVDNVHFELLKNRDKTVVLDFTADWGAPSRYESAISRSRARQRRENPDDLHQYIRNSLQEALE